VQGGDFASPVHGRTRRSVTDAEHPSSELSLDTGRGLAVCRRGAAAVSIVSLLARWDAGSQAAFVAKVNAAPARSGCAARGAPTSAALTRPWRARRLAHAPAALGSFVARSQMYLCPGGHRYMFTARARG